MRRKKSLSQRLSLRVLVIAVGASGTTAIAAESQTEEMVVTGTFLKRSAENSPSPLSVVTEAAIEDLGVAGVAEIVQTLPWASGSQTRASTFQGEGADGRNSINLRNLGHGATLPLVNGKRQVASWYNGSGEASVNINGLVPTIALERVEIIKDGASALYGSDAIAGVVNFITKRNFEGFDINFTYSNDEETREGATDEMEVIFGVQGDRGGVVVAGGYLNRDEINVDDRYDRFGGSTASATGQPGRFTPLPGQTITWAAHGLNPGQPVTGNAFPRNALGTAFGQADVDCERAAALEEGGTLPPVFGGLICPFDFGSFFALQGEESLRKMYAIGHYNLTDQVEAYFEFAANDSEFDRRNSLNPNAPALAIPTTHLGNIEDAFRRGIVPIRVANVTRLLGGTRNTPFEDRPIETLTHSNYSDQRLILGAKWEGDIASRPWSLDVSYTGSEHDEGVIQIQDTLSSHMELAIQGRGGPNCDIINGTPGEGNLAYAASGGNYAAGRCYFFNPFGNSFFARDGSRQTDLSLVNPAELYTWLSGRANSNAQYRERVIDVVASGEIFDLGANPVGIAVGFQRRRDTGLLLLDSSLTSGNLDFAFGASDWEGEITTTSVFAELGVPIGETLEINLAVRYEEFDEIEEDTTDPKLTILWRPLDELSIRASVGTSFRIPSMQQLFGSLTTVANQSDIGNVTAFLPSISPGNNELKPETAETYNIGVSYSPSWFDGFKIDLDYYDVTYEDIIAREASAAILLADNQALQAAIGVPSTDPTFAQRLADVVGAGVGNREQVVRNAQGRAVRILPNFINANSADIDGLDLTTSYTFDTGIGEWTVGLQGAWVRTYEIEQGTVTHDAVGQYNEFNPLGRPLPEFRINGTLSWSLNNHRAFMIVQYVDEIDYGIDLATDPRGGSARFWRETVRSALGESAANDFFTRDIESFTTADLQYTYSFGETSFLSDAQVTLGVKNLTDEEPPWVPVITAYDGRLHDPRGRVWYLRLGASM